MKLVTAVFRDLRDGIHFENSDCRVPVRERRTQNRASDRDNLPGIPGDSPCHPTRTHPAEALIPAGENRTRQREINSELYTDRNKIERFTSQVKPFNRVARRDKKTAGNYLAILHRVSSMV